MKLIKKETLKTLLSELKKRFTTKKNEIDEVDQNTKTYVTEIDLSEILMAKEEIEEIIK